MAALEAMSRPVDAPNVVPRRTNASYLPRFWVYGAQRVDMLSR